MENESVYAKEAERARKVVKRIERTAYVIGSISFLVAFVSYVIGGGERNVFTFGWPIPAALGVGMFLGVWGSRFTDWFCSFKQ